MQFQDTLHQFKTMTLTSGFGEGISSGEIPLASSKYSQKQSTFNVILELGIGFAPQDVSPLASSLWSKQVLNEYILEMLRKINEKPKIIINTDQMVDLYQGLSDQETRILTSLMKTDPDLILERPGALYLGNVSHAQNLEILKSKGIQVILQVSGEVTEPPHPEHFEYHQFVLGDSEQADITEHAKRAVEIIEKCHQEGKTVFVHCSAGQSRSGSLVIAYVMKTQKLSFQEALNLVAIGRPCVAPNEGFKKTLSTMQF